MNSHGSRGAVCRHNAGSGGSAAGIGCNGGMLGGGVRMQVWEQEQVQKGVWLRCVAKILGNMHR